MAKIYRVKFYDVVTEYVDENGNVKKILRYQDTKDCEIRRYVENCNGGRIYISSNQAVDGILFAAQDLVSLFSLDYPIRSVKYIGNTVNEGEG